MEEYFRFSGKKEERFLELILFAHLATIYSDSILCEQEKVLTQKVIKELVTEGHDRKDIELKVQKIEEYIHNIMEEKTKDFIMIFETSIKYALPPAETELYHRLAHVIMKGACIDDSYTEQERRLYQHFRNVVISINDEEQLKMDYGVAIKRKNTVTVETIEEISDKEPDDITDKIKRTEEKVDELNRQQRYELSFVDNTIPHNFEDYHLHKYERGVPDDVIEYEKDQIKAMEMVMRIWDIQRKKSTDDLKNIQHITSLPDSFLLNGCLYSLPASEKTEIIVVGDLHGCYNNLKAVLWQTDFMNKINTGEDVYLVFLGDFFDRGTRTLDGIMPLVLNLILEYPERVIIIRGNHEHFMENKEGFIESAVRPHETITFWKKHLSNNFFKAYMNFFEQFPLMALFSNGIIALHGGIPPRSILDKVDTLSDFNRLEKLDEKRLRYSVLWTDPGEAEDFPINLKAVFHAPFGKKQFNHFMQKIGARLLIRGHEAVENGCEFTYPRSLVTVFSAGGENNPHAFAYNNITPRYLRITNNFKLEAVKIHWENFKDENEE